MFLDRALHEEPQEIQQRFYKWYSFMMKNIEFGKFVSVLHTKNHCARVLLYNLKMAKMANLDEDGITVLCKASVFHDSRRQDDTRDVGHGARAAENYRSFCDRGLVDFDERVYLIMAYHDRDDGIGKNAFREKGLADAIPLYDLFKDADALDRWRISPTALDTKYLRTPWSKTLVQYAKDLVKETVGKSLWEDAVRQTKINKKGSKM
jgi:hypothetical protein